MKRKGIFFPFKRAGICQQRPSIDPKKERHMKVLIFNGSPRSNGNTSALLQEVMRGATDVGAQVDQIIAYQANIRYCTGCLKCNLVRHCVLRDDEWPELSQKIIESDALIFGSPVYFHHLSAPLKKILDRFRSFMEVRITESGLQHTPWHQWRKHFVLILCLGSPAPDDAQPIIDLFQFMIEVLGEQNRLTVVVGTRLAVINQVRMTEGQLQELYTKLKLPLEFVAEDYRKNQELLAQCYQLGKNLAKWS